MYVELKTGDSPSGAFGTRSGRPACTTTVDGSRSEVMRGLCQQSVRCPREGDRVVAEEVEGFLGELFDRGAVGVVDPGLDDDLDDVHRGAGGELGGQRAAVAGFS